MKEPAKAVAVRERATVHATTTRWTGLAVAVAALALCGAGAPGGDHELLVLSASLDAKGSAGRNLGATGL